MVRMPISKSMMPIALLIMLISYILAELLPRILKSKESHIKIVKPVF